MYFINLIVIYLYRKYGVPLHNCFGENWTRVTSHLKYKAPVIVTFLYQVPFEQHWPVTKDCTSTCVTTPNQDDALTCLWPVHWNAKSVYEANVHTHNQSSVIMRRRTRNHGFVNGLYIGTRPTSRPNGYILNYPLHVFIQNCTLCMNFFI